MAILKDIADKVGVSNSTVSRVLNNDEKLSISDALRKRIFEVADELDYVVKKRKKSKVSYKIGIFTEYSLKEELNDLFYLSVHIAIEKKIADKKYKMITINAGNFEQLTKNIDGVICIGKTNTTIMEKLYSLELPIVFADCSPNDNQFDSVIFDLYNSTITVLEYLNKKGHTKIAYIGGQDEINPKYSVDDERKSAYVQYMKDHSIYNPEYVIEGAYTPHQGYESFKKIMNSNDKPTAIFIGNDTLAVGCNKAASEMGINIPKDISIVGFNDISLARYMVPPLTTIRLITSYMGNEAVTLLEDKLYSQRVISKKVILQAQLIERESVLNID
jgi:LacI family transcriptional regulator